MRVVRASLLLMMILFLLFLFLHLPPPLVSATTVAASAAAAVASVSLCYHRYTGRESRSSNTIVAGDFPGGWMGVCPVDGGGGGPVAAAEVSHRRPLRFEVAPTAPLSHAPSATINLPHPLSAELSVLSSASLGVGCITRSTKVQESCQKQARTCAPSLNGIT